MSASIPARTDQAPGVGQRSAAPSGAAQSRGPVLDLIFPRRCLVCMLPVDGPRERFCDPCARSIAIDRRRAACPRCSASVAPYEVRNDQCSHCRGRRPHVAKMARVGPYGNRLGFLLRQYKYNNRGEIGPTLGCWLADAVMAAPWHDRIEAVAPVPGHWTRRFLRPTNPAHELATIVARRLGRPRVDLLTRTKAWPHQVGLTYHERLANVRGAFRVRQGVHLRDATILLVDDVRTTGATLNECAKMLRRAGAKEVFGAVVVRAHPDRASDQRLGSV